MRTIDFPRRGAAAVPMTVLGFGCAGLLGRASRRESETAFRAALDAGITFFDTARSYGYGASEGLVGDMLKGRRDQVVLCTKFGILPAPQNWKSRLLPVARKVVRAFPALRKAAQKQAGAQFTPGQFSPAALRASFETSLRELKTEYVDILLMHGAPESALAQDDLHGALSRLVERGQVCMAGISGDTPVISKFFAQRPAGLLTAQFALNASLMGFAAETERNADLLLVANHPYGGPGGVASTRATIESLASREALGAALRAKLKDSAGDPQLLPELLLNLILNGTGISAVVPAMMKVEHIRSNVRAVTECRFSSDDLSAIRAALTATLKTSSVPAG